MVGLGTGAAQMSYEHDWWRAELGALAAWVFGLLEIVTLLRFAGDTNAAGEAVLDWGDPRLWAYVIFLVSLLTVGLYGWITSRYRRKEIDN